VSESTVYRWVLDYAQKAIKILDKYKPKVSGIWVADETAIKFNAYSDENGRLSDANQPP
jgi:transposase-like protein